MNRMNRLVVLAVGLLIPSVNYADLTSDYLGSDASQAKSILPGYTQALGGATGQQSATQAYSDSSDFKRIQEKLKESQEEQEKRDRNANGRKKIDQLNKTLGLPDILALGIQKKRDEQSARFNQLFASLRQSAQGIKGSAVDVSDLEQSCREGVDFSEFKKLGDQLGSEPFKYLDKILSEKDEKQKKEGKAEKIKTLQKLAARFDEAAERADKDSATALAEEKDTKQSIIKNPYALKQRLLGMDATWDKQKKDIKDLRKQLVKTVFTDLVPKLLAIDDNDKEMAEITANFAKSAGDYLHATRDAALQGAKKLLANCKKNREKLGNGNPLAGGSETAKAYNAVVQKHDGDASFYANGQGFQSELAQASAVSCSSEPLNDIEDLFGGNLETAISAMQSQKKPEVALQNARDLLTAISSAQGQVEDVLQPLKDDCQAAATSVKNVKEFTQSLGQGGGQSASPGTPGTTRRSSNRGVARSQNARTHGGAN